ncbi:MAG TPA: FecR domain-containing protein [Rhizomicrobium sp.]|nr:FecR domain-containing protein [Rhizomicrobium sp.]
MSEDNIANPSSRAIDEAIAWHLRLGEADEKAWAEFTRWLEADAANRRAFDRIEDLDAELEDPALRNRAENRILPFTPPKRIIKFAPWIAAGAIAASVALAFVFLNPAPRGAEYATKIGETRVVMLSDGTRIDLNTATRLRAEDRHVTLLAGEALFHVKNDARNPFTVTAGSTTVRDIGTTFDILRSAKTLTVVVAEGRVGVSRAGHEVPLAAGDKLVRSETTGSTEIEKVDPQEALAWTKGYLVYRNAPLSAVVRDLNRYFPNQVMLDSRAAGDRFTGVLRIDNQDAILERLSRFLPVRVEREKDGGIVLRAIAPGP